jgi:ATP/maltotriose-dependent transcriptional regulator MalT
MKRTPPPYAKVIRPALKGVIPRTRLFDRLDHLRERPLIWVCGPAGCGKTTLLASYLESRRLPLLWYQVDAGDKDPATFFYYMRLAAKRAAPGHRKSLPLLTPEYLAGLPAFTRRYFENICARIRTPAALVLDNLQEAGADPGFHELIREGLSRLPEGLNAFLISRHAPPPAFARMLANQEMTILGWEELRLTQEESAEIIRRRSAEPPSQEDLLHFHRAADGWVVGLVLILEWARREKIEPRALHRATPEEILAYFGSEVFETLDYPTQEFLLKTALLPRMTAEMAEDLTGQPAAAATLSGLSRQNNFTERRVPIEPVYQYHPLFREFLLSRERGFFRPEELSGLRRRAAVLLEEGGETEAAASLFCESADWKGLVALILKEAPALLASGRHRALEGWLTCLPAEILAGDPWLLYWTGMCRLPFSPPQGHDFLEKALELFKARRDAVGTFLSISGLFDTITYGLGSFAPFDRILVLLEEALQEFRSFPSLEIEARLTASMLGAMALRQPQHPELDTRAERALALIQQTPDLNARMQILQAIALHRLLSGEFSKAEPVLDAFRKLAQAQDVAPLFLIVSRELDAFYYWSIGAFEENRKAVAEGLEMASATGVHLFDSFLLGHGAAGALSAGDMAAAKAFLKKISSHLDRTALWERAFYYVLSLWASLLERNLPKALADAELCLKLSREAGMPTTEAFCFVGSALVLHESKRTGRR